MMPEPLSRLSQRRRVRHWKPKLPRSPTERRAKNRTGLGLGLSIARRAVRAQGGDIEVRNTPGKGCTFVIAVPAAAERVASDVVGEPAS